MSDLKEEKNMAEFSAAQWKEILRENITPVIERELKLKQIGDVVWASDYNMGMRKVLSLFYINDAYATFSWGINFEFVPKCPGKKVVWARTDKSIYSHIYELSEKFYDVSNLNDKEKAQARL